MASKRFAGWIGFVVLTAALGALAVATDIALAAHSARAARGAATKASLVSRPQVGAGAFAGYAIKPDGSLWAWGANVQGQLGLGNIDGHGVGLSRLLPQHVGQSTSWRTLAAGQQNCLALKSDGSLWAWGSNDLGQLGLGGSNAPRLSPKRVGNGHWRAIGSGIEFSAGIKRDGSLWSWGSNYLGQLGLGDTKSCTLPTRIGNETDWKAIAVGYDYVLAIKADGSLWSWGGNDSGQLGNGTADPAPDNEHPAVPHPTPVRIGSDTDWSVIAAGGGISLALKRDGSLWSWGLNGSGQLGLGDTLVHLLPMRVGIDSDWKAIAAGNSFSLGLKRNGSLWAWGENGSGQLGLRDRVSRQTPTRVGSKQWMRIAAGDEFSLAVKLDGTFWSWGGNYTGKLGLGDRHDRLVPVRITRL
jgi:alpha-tubulin suppressor-like RCC1 family protein